MSVYALCKALHYVCTTREAAMAARAGDFSAFARFALTDDQRQALEGQDLVALYRLGAHPLLLFHFAVVLDSRERYVREVVPQLAGLSNPFYDYDTRGRRERRGQ